jgi:hypothetical protein
VVGKTVERVAYRERGDEAVRLYFTDGSALLVDPCLVEEDDDYPERVGRPGTLVALLDKDDMELFERTDDYEIVCSVAW